MLNTDSSGAVVSQGAVGQDMTDLFAIQETSLALLRGDRAGCLPVRRKEKRGGGGTQQISVRSSLAFHGSVLRDFANSRGRPKNKNTSLGPFNRWEHQNCSTARTGLSSHTA
jgi:hypothetical protein